MNTYETVLYGKLFDNSKLFIILGCSLGKSDNWWWRKIYFSILRNDSEVIIYNFGEENEPLVKEKFINGCCLQAEERENIDIVKEKIYIINYGPNSSRIFLRI